jgi:hypothetical protein
MLGRPSGRYSCPLIEEKSGVSCDANGVVTDVTYDASAPK